MFSVRRLCPQKLLVPQTTETTQITFKFLQDSNSGISLVGSFTVWTFTAILCQQGHTKFREQDNFPLWGHKLG